MNKFSLHRDQFFTPSEIKGRIVLLFVIIISLLIFSWWVTTAFIVFGIVRYPFYGEAIIFAYFADVLFGTARLFGHFTLVMTITAATLILVSIVIKSFTRSKTHAYSI